MKLFKPALLFFGPFMLGIGTTQAELRYEDALPVPQTSLHSELSSPDVVLMPEMTRAIARVKSENELSDEDARIEARLGDRYRQSIDIDDTDDDEVAQASASGLSTFNLNTTTEMDHGNLEHKRLEQRLHEREEIEREIRGETDSGAQ